MLAKKSLKLRENLKLRDSILLDEKSNSIDNQQPFSQSLLQDNLLSLSLIQKTIKVLNNFSQLNIVKINEIFNPHKK